MPLAKRVAFRLKTRRTGGRRAAFCSGGCCGYVLGLFAQMAHSSGWEFFSNTLSRTYPLSCVCHERGVLSDWEQGKEERAWCQAGTCYASAHGG